MTRDHLRRLVSLAYNDMLIELDLALMNATYVATLRKRLKWQRAVTLSLSLGMIAVAVATFALLLLS